ncbi:hypothetical protein AKJ16_DCAP24950 [Drosera capensis]
MMSSIIFERGRLIDPNPIHDGRRKLLDLDWLPDLEACFRAVSTCIEFPRFKFSCCLANLNGITSQHANFRERRLFFYYGKNRKASILFYDMAHHQKFCFHASKWNSASELPIVWLRIYCKFGSYGSYKLVNFKASFSYTPLLSEVSKLLLERIMEISIKWNLSAVASELETCLSLYIISMYVNLTRTAANLFGGSSSCLVKH